MPNSAGYKEFPKTQNFVFNNVVVIFLFPMPMERDMNTGDIRNRTVLQRPLESDLCELCIKNLAI